VPAIAASGQVYILNGQLTVTSGPGGYLATGSPLVYAGSLYVVNPTTGTINLPIPAGARALIIQGANGIINNTIVVQGATSAAFYLAGVFKGSTWAAAQLAVGIDTNVILSIVPHGYTENFYYYWAFNLDDFGQWMMPGNGGLPKATMNYGKNSVITNPRVPVRIGADNADPSIIQTSYNGNAAAVLLTAPGAGQTLVLWRYNIRYVANAAGYFSLLDTNNSNVIGEVYGNASQSKSENLNGLRLSSNNGLTVTYSLAFNSTITVYYTVENT
jgi:hypothetical protein